MIVSDAALPAMSSQQTAPSSVGTLAIDKIEYWHQDYQGSLVATTDHAGAVTARYAYDPFGQRRPTDGNVDAAGALMIDWRPDVNTGTSRGYTGHEHRDDIGLINMNGRIFDGRAGVFLQADPVLQDRLNTQNFGAYAYVFNNPLNATDPSGMVGCKPGECPQLPRVPTDGKRSPLSEDRFADDDRWLPPLPTWAPNGEIQWGKDQADAAKLRSFVQNCLAGSCLRLEDDPLKAGSAMPNGQTGQFGWSTNPKAYTNPKARYVAGKLRTRTSRSTADAKYGYDANDVRGGFSGAGQSFCEDGGRQSGESLAFHPDIYDPDAAGEILIEMASFIVLGPPGVERKLALQAIDARKAMIDAGFSTPAEAATFFGWKGNRLIESAVPLTRENMRAAGLTAKSLQNMADAFRGVYTVTPENLSAAMRADHLELLVKVMK
ncbi:RHS repeat domain-containing protein [Roseateles chitinivorans]|uniref:RHS repeat domain-containing protein n=1 Tax=Roseateles chitinivorans TaxID=2917965 RepID=UPI003D667768